MQDKLADIIKEQEAVLAEMAARKLKNEAEIMTRLENNQRILRSQIAKIVPGEYFTALEGVRALRIETEDPNQILLDNLIGPGITIVIHDHDCPERGTVLEGELIVNDQVLGPGDTYYFPAETMHFAWSETGCRFLTEFPE